MGQTKEEVIAQLQCLSDGLAVISRIKDNIRENEGSIYNQEKKIQDEKDAYEEFESAAKELEKEYEDIVTRYNNAKESFNDNVRRRLKGVLGHGLIIAFIVSLFAILVCGFLFSGFILIGLIVPFIFLMAYFIKRFAERNKIVAELNVIMRQFSELIDQANDGMLTANQLRPSKVKDMNREIAVYNNVISRLKNENANLSSQADAYYKQLEERYSSLLLPEDWDGVDYIIFCLRSDRAETIHESLPFADMQRRHDEIIDTTEKAAEEIKGTLRSEFDSLESATRVRFRALTEQVDSFGKDVIELQETIIQLLGIINAKADAQLSATQANTAAISSAKDSLNSATSKMSSAASGFDSAKKDMNAAKYAMNSAREDYKKNSQK